MVSLKTVLPGLALVAGLATSAPVLAQGNVPEVGEEDFCLPLNRIDRTTAVDNRTIVVEMKGKDGWRKIETAGRCPGLKFENSFSYDTSLAELCAAETITVLNTGSRCGLSSITVITEEDARALLASR